MLRRLALHTGPYRRSGRIQAAASRSLFSLRSSPQKTAGISESAGLISVPNTRELGLVRRKASSKRHLATEVGTAATMKMSESADPWAATYSISPLYNHLNPDVLPDGYEQTRDSHGREYAVLQKPIVKSQSDDREYRMIRLKNGLEAILICDPSADKAAASLCVRVGHLSDPVELQGLAHFCEHLLFMGTEKYPRENEYSEYLSSNSGSSNAFTGMDETNYHFDVHPDSLDGALDRFAQFFISPLFDPSCTEREIQAVDSENKKNLQSDMWRMYQLEKSLSSKSHAYWRFGTGNLDSLWTEPRKNGLDPRAELLKFHKRHYSANLCKLAVVGKSSLDEMTSMVLNRFSDAHNSNLQPPLFAGSPFTNDQLKQEILVKTVKDVRHLELTFPFPDQDPLFASKPGTFLSHFIGHEGPGSILSLLKAKGWANSLSAGCSTQATGFSFFKVNLDLTAEGLQHHQEVANIIFQYLELLKSQEPQEWAFKEVAMLSEIGFRFQEKSQPMSYVTSLSSCLHKPYPRHQILSAHYTLPEFDKAEIKKALNLLQLDNCRVTVGAQKPLDGLEYGMSEKWYGTRYTIRPLKDALLKKTEAAQDLSLPEPNAFVPSRLDILNANMPAEPTHKPELVSDVTGQRLWHKLDDRWRIPKAAATFSIKLPDSFCDPRSNIKAHLFANLVEDSLAEYAYDADLAGLSFGIHVQPRQIALSVDGYNDKLDILHNVVAERLTHFKVDPQRFELIKDQIQRGLENFRLSDPYQHASFHLSHFIVSEAFEPEEQLAELLTVEADELQDFVGQIFKTVSIEAVVHGNILQDSARELVSCLVGHLGVTPVAQLPGSQALTPPAGNYRYQAQIANPDQLNSAVNILYHVGSDADQDTRVKLSLLAQLAKENCFDQLRTKEQLGYIAQSGRRQSINFAAFAVIVQSERDANYVDERVEHWLTTFREFVQDMSEDDFAQHRQSLVNSKKEDFKNMSEEMHAYNTYIQSGTYDFGRKLSDASAIAKLSKSDILEFHDTFVSAASPKRRKLAVHMRSQCLNEDALNQLCEKARSLKIESVEALREALKNNPTVEETKKFTTEVLTKHAISTEQIYQIQLYLDSIATPAAPEGVTLVDKSWRANLTPAGQAKVVSPYERLQL